VFFPIKRHILKCPTKLIENVLKLVPTCLLVLFFIISGAMAENQKISFVTDTHKKNGYLVAITKEAFKRVGYDVDVTYMPWNRALVNVMEGRNEALLAAYYTDERAGKMLYSHSIGQTEIVLFKRQKSTIEYSDLTDLKSYTIGTIRGAATSTEFDAADYLEKIVLPSPDIMIKMLLADRIDLLVEQRKVIHTYLKNQFPNDINSLSALAPPLQVSKYFCTFSKKSPRHEKLVSDFNQGLQQIKMDGTYQRLINEYDHP